MADALEIVAKFIADTGDLEAGAQKAKGALGGISAESLLMGGAVVAAVGTAVVALAGMVKAADEDRAAQEKLDITYKNSGAAVGDYKTQIDAAIDSGKAKAFSDDEVRAGLDSLVTSTGDAQKANELLGIAMDVARAAGVPLAQASDAVAKANEGSAGALQKLLPGLDAGKNATETLANAQKAAAGQSDAFAKSTDGQMKIAGDAFSELQETIGSAFLPIIDELVPAITPFVEMLGQIIKAVMPPLIVIIKDGVVPAFKLILDVVKILFDWVGKIATAISKTLKPVLDAIIPILRAVGDAIQSVVGFLRGLVDWVGNAVDAIGRFLDAVNPLKGFKMPSISLPFSLAAPAATGASSRSSRATTPAPQTTVNVQVMSADPGEVMRAIRRWATVNGGSKPFARALDT